ncbi:hypothetical protein AXE80_09415 [Wenyingzhuangia fucanilytica]|uniref:Nicotinic acid mononucleotide adenyltransferase n=1 Tax=Wenyingzhuangia fucanilytica TaxID=1790137 RepID=A0A1B1Y6W8_9FLAO|nr:hypothetical protein [Wenyingzhuangia fucanilytica]ANW96484.1 hypothetical protein AXE80_09415 [Wenyingzhuangia fucanilytica]
MKGIALILSLFVGVFTYAQNDVKIVKQGDMYKVTYFHENGKVAQTGFIDADKKMQGTWIAYAPTGEKKSTGEYKDGKKTGTWYFESNTNSVTQVDYGTDSRVASVYQLKSDKSQLADSDTEE